MLQRFSQRFSKNPLIERSLRHSVRDGMACSVAAGGGETYFSAFALFLRATAPQVAVLTTLPPLLGSLAQILSAWAGRRLGRKRLILIGAAAQAALWLPILAVPLAFPQQAVLLLLLLLTLFHASANLAAPQWTSLMRDLVAERRRGRYFGHRTRLTTLTSFAALVAGGLVLHAFDTAGATAAGFTTLFVVAGLARAVSVYHLSFLDEPSVKLPLPALPLREWWRNLGTAGTLGFSLYYMLMHTAVAIASPFFAVYMLRDLQFTYLQFMLNAGTSVFVQFLTLHTWGRLADIYGNRPILRVTSLVLPVVPALWLVSGDFRYLLLVQCIAGLGWAGFSLSAANLMFELVPRERRAAYLACHNVATAGGVFTGAMLGAALAAALPAASPWLGAEAVTSNLLYLFLLSAAARAVLAVLLGRRLPQLEKPRRVLSAPAMVLRVTGFSAFLGLWYELIGAGPRKSDATREPAAEAGTGRRDGV